MSNKRAILATASLIGTIIGAGVFGIPYIVAKSGVIPCLFYFVILGAVVFLLHLIFGEVVLRTKGKHRLVGYVERYFGKKAKGLVAFSVILGTMGALLAYIILGGDFLKIAIPLPLSSFQFSLILWAALSFFVLLGIKSIAPVELFMNVGFFAIIIVVFVFAFPKVQASNFTLFNARYLFLPFGVLLFSLVGWNAVPEIEGLLPEKKKLKKVIIAAMIIAVIFYLLFGFIISGVTGEKTSQEAFGGLSAVLGKKVMVLGGIFGVLTISTSFLVLGNYLKNTLRFDYHLPYPFAFLIACLAPLVLFLAGVRQFIQVIGVVGTLVGLVEGMAIVLIYQKAKKQGEQAPAYQLKVPNFLIYFVMAVLVLGTVAQIFYPVK